MKEKFSSAICQHLLHLFCRDDLHFFQNRLRDIDKIFLVLRRDDDRLDPAPDSRQDFLLQAADRENLAAQGDLAGHGHIPSDRSAGKGGNQGGCHGYPRRRPVFRYGTRRDMHMNLDILEEVIGEIQLFAFGTDPRKRRLHRLLHDITQMTGKGKRPLAVHDGCFDMQDLTADRSPGKTGHQADLVLLRLRFTDELRRAEILADIGGIDHETPLIPFGNLPGDFAADAADFALQISEPGFAGIAGDQGLDRLVGKGDDFRA